MLIIRYALLILGVLLVAVAEDSQECGYFDTVDLRDSQRLDNGSYLYKHISIPSDKVHEYHDQITITNRMKLVEPYMRGCLCHIKPCVLLCCEPKKYIRNLSVNVTLLNGKESQIDVINDLEFVMQIRYKMSCDIFEDPEYYDPNWKLFQDGTLHNQTDDSVILKENYCLMPHKVDKNYYLVPKIIMPQIQIFLELDVMSAMKVISVFCLGIITVVHLYLPDLRTRVYSQTSLCYIICITITMILLWSRSLFLDKVILCHLTAYCGYYMVMSSLLWLLAINYILWNLIRNDQNKQVNNMLKYHIIVWGSAAILLTIAGSMNLQDMDDMKKEIWQPYTVGCWINKQSWSAMIYYYGPIFVGIVVNLIFSIITLRCIYVEKPEDAITKSDFKTFFQMIIITGVIWLLEITSFILTLFHIDKAKTWVDYSKNLILNNFGLILLFVTIWKKDVLYQLNSRLERKHNEISIPNLSSNHTASTTVLN
ncbi:probable G-protein coupled receptor Mth-like 11 [Drosophila nasuta]|uniref:probable G-protein coupled receptor Mth-like 11 n=1 Tax=Drosophila nasuta TaxID=42062 RepID=UPI00295F024A|nr:probable G-protein coupled receptor Mth-like 11 [Drosophila nasuta]